VILIEGIAFGTEGGVPAGYARCAAGRSLLRGHSPDRQPEWYGPAVGGSGDNRFDWPGVRGATDPGVCYLAVGLEGVLLERVIRDRDIGALSRATLRRDHAVATAVPTRDLVLIDLVVTLKTKYQLEVDDISYPPPYMRSQDLARQWYQAPHPMPVDGILYMSRFGPAHACLALWDRTRGALAWGTSQALDERPGALETACDRLGLGLIP
jgi:hypothetical protein